MEHSEASQAQTGGRPEGAEPFGALQPLADLLNPIAAARELPWLTTELLRIAAGTSDISFDEKDPRFEDVTWQSNPFYNRIGQGYRLFEQWFDRLAAATGGGWERQARARHAASVITGAMSPTNFLLTNPLALKRAFETGGTSLVRGGKNMLRDLAEGGMPRMVDREPFPVGEKLACTPGAVVFRDDMFELLQYDPSTPSVHRRPLVMVPPELNRHYVLDLAPGRSVAEYAVEHGIQTFMVVWKNPRAELGHGRWGLNEYLAAHGRALEVVRKISHSETVNWLGLCAGGITTALFLGYLAAKGDAHVNSATFIVTILANTSPNVIGMLDTARSREMVKRAAAAGEVFPGDMVRSGFAWLRPNDLVFNYLVRGWLLGEDPPAFDVLAWNHDATALSAKFALESNELILSCAAAHPGAVKVLGTPIDFGKVDCDSFHVAGYTDHITPWRACYSTTQILGGDKELVVVKSGHIQSFVNPAASTRYDYWAGRPADPEPDVWLAKATLQHGSWWPRWA
ncbi:MAG TPA: alpha/beta fold hydrolase, partial [Streptosporangiaceae bacterium]|nr:alpha/beta fold hydrolase [Streptosporangiaceae bacterium]